MNSLYGVQIRKDDVESKKNLETWMQTEYDENVLYYWKLLNDTYNVKFKKMD